MVVTCATFQSPISPYVLVTVVLPAPPVVQSLTAATILASVSGSGAAVGLLDGTSEGAPLGLKDGAPVGIELGANEGLHEGCDDDDGSSLGD
jgi:hypothetical protein